MHKIVWKTKKKHCVINSSLGGNDWQYERSEENGQIALSCKEGL